VALSRIEIHRIREQRLLGELAQLRQVVHGSSSGYSGGKAAGG